MRKRWKNINKGFRDTKYEKEKETLCEYKETKERIGRKSTDEFEQWKEESEDIELECKVNIP